jgi:hypothetical protein
MESIDIVIVVGDAIITAVQEASLYDLAGGDKRQWLFVSSNEGMLDSLQPLLNRYPRRLDAVWLRKPWGITPAGFDDATRLTAEERRFRFDDRTLYANGDSYGAQTRAEAAMRVICNRDLGPKLAQALQRVTARQPTGPTLPLRLLLAASTYRCTGSAASAPLVGAIYQQTRSYAESAEITLDVLLATQCVTLPEPHASRARMGRYSALTELELALSAGIEVAPGIAVPPGFVGFCYELGAPGHQQGVLATEAEARAALALCLRSLLAGGIAEELAALRSHDIGVTMSKTALGARRGYSGIGALEIIFEPATARAYLERYLLATLPPP